jgi:hypothetical protein
MAQQPPDERLEVPPVHDRIHHPVIPEELGRLEPLRQVLA